MISKDREYRSFDFDSNDDTLMVEGTAIVFDTPTLMYEIDGIKYYEVIERGALDDAIMNDVVLNVDHQGKPAAKTKNKTLLLHVDERGLHIEADLSKNATGRELYEDIKNGFFDKMSFAFVTADETYDRENRTRVIKKVERLYDVSAVTVPAYSQTTLQSRSFFDAEAEKERMEIRNKSIERKKLLLRLQLGKGNEDGN